MPILPPPQLEESWKIALEKEWTKPYLRDLASFVTKERASSNIPVYPPKNLVFNAFNQTSFSDVQVVIMGQDPYHGAGQAHGLSFSVPHHIPQPPSLKNIFKELQEDLGEQPPSHGCLIEWAKQGVLLLNAILTVRANQPGSHQGQGWEQFTDAVVSALSQRNDPVIFVLWGKSAQEKCKSVLASTPNRHFVLTAPHPSPYSAYSGFFGCRHFSKINELLKSQGKQPIRWGLSDAEGAVGMGSTILSERL